MVTPSLGQRASTSLKALIVIMTCPGTLVAHFGPTSAMSWRRLSGISISFVMALYRCLQADELPLRVLLHCITDAFAPEAGLPDAPERVHVEAKAARLVDPHRTRIEPLGHFHGRIQARSEA